MKNIKIWITIGIVVLIAGLFGINGWINAGAKSTDVEVTTLKEEKIADKVLTQGTLKLAEEQTVYYTPENGEIAEILVSEGDDIDQGTPLLRYENDQLALEQKQNGLQQQSANLQLSDLQKQHKELDKQVEEDEENEVLQAEHDQLKLQQQQANIEMEQLQLQNELVDRQIADLEVTSDIAGKVVEVNEQATVSTNGMEQLPLIRLGSLDQLVVEGEISEYDTLNIADEQTVKLTSDAIPDKSWTGKVSYISYLPNDSGLEMENGDGGVQYPIEITVDNGDIGLKPGFQMIVEITTDEYTAKILPLTALKQDGDVNYVYVVKDGKVERREVSVGTASIDTIEIKDGVTETEQVIIEPAENITEGMDVTVP